MAYFDCIVGGSGKGNTVTVTCAEEFAGLTITLAKTGKTYTKTCPSTAPYVVTFNGVENGTYTVNTTYDGQTYSETVIVQDISCVLNYGFTWRIWVDTASQLDSSDYDSLDEVLADEKALRELFLEHACVDYMASVGASNEDLETVINNDLCAKWINLSDYALDFLHANEVIADLMDEADKYGYGELALMPQVPIMTSATAPSGTCYSYPGDGASMDRWYAFNRDTSNHWGSSEYVNDAPYWVGYGFDEPKTIFSYEVMFYNNVATAYTISAKIQYSLDNSSWTDAATVSVNVSAAKGNSSILSGKFDVPITARYFRIIRVTGNDRFCVTNFQLYAMAPKGNIPVMTSNTAPYGTASASAVSSSNYDAWKAFDGVYDTGWAASNTGYLPTGAYITYKSANPIMLKSIMVSMGIVTAISNPNSTFKIQGSNDGTTYEDIGSTHTVANDALNYIVDIGSEKYYLYHRLVTTTNGGNALRTLQFYGRELKVSVPTMTSDTAPYGEAFADVEVSTNFLAYKAFDNIETEYYWGANDANAGHYCGYKFKYPVTVKHIYVRVGGHTTPVTQYVSSFKLQGSNDGFVNDIHDLTDAINATVSDYKKYVSVDNDTAYTSFRIYTLAAVGYSYINSIQFYGLDYSEKEFEAGTTKKWLYDHGLELEEISKVKGTSTTSSKFTTDMDELYTPALSGTNNNTNNYSVAQIGGIDFTDYSLIRCIVGSRSIAANNETFNFGVDNALFVDNSTYSDSNMVARSLVNTPITNPTTLALDVSNVNGEKAAHIGTFAGNGRSISITEWWLE